jgi:hypothetical protein
VRSAFLFLALPFLAWPGQSSPPSHPNRRIVLERLANDLSAAMPNAQLSQKDAKKLDAARGVFQDTSGLKGRLTKADHKDLHNAIHDVSKRTKKFREEDRNRIEADLRDAHRLGLDREPAARPLRRPRPLYPRPWP